MTSPRSLREAEDGSFDSPGSAPVIHIHEGQGGEDNEAFIFDDEDLSIQSDKPGVKRRASCDPSTASLLAVPPREPRRHSLSLSSTSEFSLPDVETEGPEYASNNHRGSTITIDYLGLPSLHPPRPHSPGAASVQSYWSELVRLKDRRDSTDSFGSQASMTSYQSKHSGHSVSALSTAVSERIINLVQKFTNRTEYFKEMTVQPPTPSTDGTHSAMSVDVKPRQHRLASFIPLESRNSISTISDVLDNDGGIFMGEEKRKPKFKIPRFLRKMNPRRTIDPTSIFYAMWLMLVTLAYTYNAAAIPLRGTFLQAEYYHKQEVVTYKTEEVCESSNNCTNKTVPVVTYVTRYKDGIETPENRYYWWFCDYLADLIYLLDIILVKVRIRFVKNGLMEKNRSESLRQYVTSKRFKIDLASLIPLDLLYFIPQLNYNSLVRLPRLLKIQTFWEFYDRVDQSVTNPHVIRVMRTLTYMLFLIHIESCGYFLISKYERLGYNKWVYSGEGNAYVRCMYLSTKTATSIGNNPKPQNTLEYSFMTVYWLSGVFVFAMLIGQIRDIFQAANAAKTQYRETMDKTLSYINSMHIPKEMQDKVRKWFNYNWEHQKTLNENLLLEALPRKMKADLAIQVHFEILNKVTLFQECEKMLLFDLVLKLNPVLYLPGDYICVKGEVGTEMYIVMSGQVEVVGGENNDIVFATLHEGSVFGEISLLAVGGGNRRTANVRSKGYSQLFILSKVDFEEAMTCYPDAQKILKKKAKKLLNNNKKMEDSKKVEAQEVIKSREGTPKMLKTVIKVIDPESKIHSYLKTNRDADKKNKDQTKDENSDEENDELLVVEQIERPLSEAELQRYSDRDQSNNTGQSQQVLDKNRQQQSHTNYIVVSPNPSYNSTDEKIEEIFQATCPSHMHNTENSHKHNSITETDAKNQSQNKNASVVNVSEDTIQSDQKETRTRKIGQIHVVPEERPRSAEECVRKSKDQMNLSKSSLAILNPSFLFTVGSQQVAQPGDNAKKEDTKRSQSVGLPYFRNNKVGITEHKHLENGISVSRGPVIGSGMSAKTVENKGCSVFNVTMNR